MKTNEKIEDFLDDCLDRELKPFSKLMQSYVECSPEFRMYICGENNLNPKNMVCPFDIIRKMVQVISDGEENISMVEHPCADWIAYFTTDCD